MRVCVRARFLGLEAFLDKPDKQLAALREMQTFLHQILKGSSKKSNRAEE